MFADRMRMQMMKSTDQGHLPIQSPLIPYKVVLIWKSLNYTTTWRLHYMLLWGQCTLSTKFSIFCENHRGLLPGTNDNHIWYPCVDSCSNPPQMLVLVYIKTEADGHRVDQSASIKIWFKLSYWLIQWLLTSAFLQTSKSDEVTVKHPRLLLSTQWASLPCELWSFRRFPTQVTRR